MNIKYHILGASLLISFILWLSLSLNLTYEIEKKVPIKINVDKPYAISNYIPLNLDVKLKGKGWTLLKLYTSINLDFNYDINASPNDQLLILTKQHLNEYEALGENLSITYIKPESLYVKIGRYEEKYIKLTPKVIVECKDGYQTVAKPILEPDSIKIGGALSIISSLNSIPTQLVSYRGVNSSITDYVKLKDSLSNIIWKSQDEVLLKIPVELTAEKNIQDVEVRISNLPQDRDVLLIPQYANLHLRGGVNQLAGIDKSKLSAEIDFKDLLSDTTGAVTPKFVMPEGVTLLLANPDKIQYIIKKKY